jgi:hypothetical protein
MRRLARPQNADRGADEEDAEEDQPGDATALAEHAVGDRGRGEGEEECDDHSHAAGILSVPPVAVSASERRACLAQEGTDSLANGARATSLTGGANEPTADDDAVGNLANLHSLGGRADAKTDRDRNLGL